MGRPKGSGLFRDKNFTIRLTEQESAKITKLARQAELPKEAYARCKIFDIPFTEEGGKAPRGRPKRVNQPAAPDPEGQPIT